MRETLNVIVLRILLGLLTLLVVSIVVFLAVDLLPGDSAQAMLGQFATPESLAALRKELMLDLPAPTRYVHWIANLLHGDLGTSLSSRRRIADLLSQRLPNTLFLATMAAAISVPMSLLLGLLSALYRDSVFDRAANAIALTAISLPEFLVGYLLILAFAVKLALFPPISFILDTSSLADRIHVTILPAVTLTLATAAHMMRMTRASIINLLSTPYIEMAELKGLRPSRIILRHALPNALGPIANVIALNMAVLIVGVVVIETVFAYPGLGQLFVDSVAKRDIPVVQIVCLVFASTYIVLNLLADLVAVVTNPRLLYAR